MTDVPLLLAISGAAAAAFRRGGDGWPWALAKGGAVGFAAMTVLTVALAVTVSGAPRREGAGAGAGDERGRGDG